MAYDLLIKNGLVIDGTGTSGRHADVAVTNGKISSQGQHIISRNKVVRAYKAQDKV